MLETKNSHNNYKKYRKKNARRKLIFYNIFDIWSLELVHVDMLSDNN